MGKRINTATWLENQQRWQLKVQKNGERRTFTSSKPGRTGQREANAKADAWLDEGIVSQNLRVFVLWQQFADTKLVSASQDAYEQTVKIGDNYVLPVIGQYKISDVTEAHLQNVIDLSFKKGCLKKGYKQRRPQSLPLSKKTVLNIMNTEKAFIKYCRAVLKVTTLFPEMLHVPKSARYKGKNILQPEALQTLFTVDSTIMRGNRVFDSFIYAYRFQVATGLRPGELVGLQVGDIRPDNTVMIRRAENINGIQTNGKNENAQRNFVMSPQAQQAYKDQLRLLENNDISINLTTPLFQISCQHTYYGRWTKYLSSNEIPHISPYELRHTFVSIAKYLPSGQIKPLVGHSAAMDTFGQYGHKLNGDDEKTAEDIGNLFKKLIGT